MTDDLETLIKWLRIKEEFEDDFSLSSVDQLEADIHHSALLERMIDGEEPLDLPPPLNNGYPWYSLVENGEAEAYEAVEIERGGKKYLIIDQDFWEIVETVSQEEWVVKHKNMPETKWEVKKFGDNWKVKRFPETQPFYVTTGTTSALTTATTPVIYTWTNSSG